MRNAFRRHSRRQLWSLGENARTLQWNREAAGTKAIGNPDVKRNHRESRLEVSAFLVEPWTQMGGLLCFSTRYHSDQLIHAIIQLCCSILVGWHLWRTDRQDQGVCLREREGRNEPRRRRSTTPWKQGPKYAYARCGCPDRPHTRRTFPDACDAWCRRPCHSRGRPGKRLRGPKLTAGYSLSNDALTG